MDNLFSYLFDCDFNDYLQSNDIEYVWATIKSHIYAAMTLYIPKQKIRRANHPRWFTSDIIHHLNCVRTLRRKAKAHPTEHNTSNLKSSELCLKEKTLLAKTQYETKLIHERVPLPTVQESTNTSVELTVTIPSHKLCGLSLMHTAISKKSLFLTHTFIPESSFLVPPELFLPDLILSDIAFF